MGRIHKKLNQPDEAMLRFITALDLDPKDRNLVKSKHPTATSLQHHHNTMITLS
jgi:hypothetical protein